MDGYWLTNAAGRVYAFGAPTFDTPAVNGAGLADRRRSFRTNPAIRKVRAVQGSAGARCVGEAMRSPITPYGQR